jgi:hypothetical protein
MASNPCWTTEIRFPAGGNGGNFHLRNPFQTDSGAHPASYPSGTKGSYPGGTAGIRETRHSPPSSAEVKNTWSCTSTHRIRLHSVVLN